MQIEDDENRVAKIPNLEASQLAFLASQHPDNKEELLQKLWAAIDTDEMGGWYRHTFEKLKVPVDEAREKALQEKNKTKLEQLEAAITEAEKNQGENEIREALLAKADYLTKIGEKDKALAAYKITSEKTVALGQKLDIVFTQIRIGLFYHDNDLVIRNIEKAKAMVEEGGDWDRRNRLKVYEALYFLSVRNFAKSAKLFLETLSTFTSYELFTYETFIFYTVIVSVISLDRVTLLNRVINAPEVLSVIHSMPVVGDYVNSLYASNYKQFFRSLAAVMEMIKKDPFLSSHAKFYCREMRILSYSQLLESYRSVTLANMAAAFGVSVDFLDKELSRFIASARIPAKIDKVHGIVETNRADNRNQLYLQTIKNGDLLLARIQKLSRVINL